jgi:hypothetical protein
MPDAPQSVTTKDFDDNVRWEPFIDGPRVGYKVTRLSDGAVTFMYMNPSTSGEDQPDLFIYGGPANDAAEDSALYFLHPTFKET